MMSLFVWRYKTYGIIFLFCVITNCIYAQSDPFERLDNNIFLGAGFETQGPYTSSIYDSGVNVLSQNIWVNAVVSGITSCQYTSYQPYLINSGGSILGKVGYSFIMDHNLNLIPYGGLEYGSQEDTFHNDSDPIYTSNTDNMNMMLGIHPEWLINSNTKFAIDTSFNYSSQAQIVPNTASTLVHSAIDNYYFLTDPSIQWNPFGQFSIEAYYQIPFMLTDNTSPYALFVRGFDSQTLVNYVSNPGQMLGVRVEYLF